MPMDKYVTDKPQLKAGLIQFGTKEILFMKTHEVGRGYPQQYP